MLVVYIIEDRKDSRGDQAADRHERSWGYARDGQGHHRSCDRAAEECHAEPQARVERIELQHVKVKIRNKHK